MGKHEKLLLRVLRGTSDSNVLFDDLCQLLIHLGFRERIKGSHRIFAKPEVAEILNLQPKGGRAKSYQVRQVRNIILKYKLGDVEDDD